MGSEFDSLAERDMLKQAGIEQALVHAEDVSPQWRNKAFNALTEYLREHPKGYLFQVEDFRKWALLNEKIQDPPSARAYGGIIVRAANQSIIRRDGFASTKSKTAHGAVAAQWRKI